MRQSDKKTAATKTPIEIKTGKLGKAPDREEDGLAKFLEDHRGRRSTHPHQLPSSAGFRSLEFKREYIRPEELPRFLNFGASVEA